MTRITPTAARRLLGGLLSEPTDTPRRPKRIPRPVGLKPQPTPQEPAQTTTAPLIVSVAGHAVTVNHMYRPRRGGGKVLTEAAQAWYDFAIPTIRADAQGYAVPAGSLRLTVVVYALPRTTDIDNILKGSVDAIARALDFDDRRIDYLAVARGIGKPARTVYTLEQL